MQSSTIFLGLIIFGGMAFTISYFVMRKASNYTNGSLRKSHITDEAVERLRSKVLISIKHSNNIHGKNKIIS